jgi:hypothetical protein
MDEATVKTLSVTPTVFVVSVSGEVQLETDALLAAALAALAGVAVIVDLLEARNVGAETQDVIVDSSTCSKLTVVAQPHLLHAFELLGETDVGLETSLSRAVAAAA